MWWKTIFRQRPKAAASAMATGDFDEQFLRRLERLSLTANRTLRGGLTGAHPSKRRLPAPTISDHRPYTHGDDLRYVDWNAYARQNDLIIKMGEAEQDVRVELVLDCSGSMDFGEGSLHKWRWARQLTAAIGYCALAGGDRVSLHTVAPGASGIWTTRSRHEAPAFVRLLGKLAAGGRGNLAATLSKLSRGLTGGIVVVVSDLWHVDDLGAVLRTLQTPRWQVIVLQVLHPAECTPQIDGDIELVDSETGVTQSLHVDGAARERYVARFEAWSQSLARTCDRYGANYLRCTTDQPLERAVLPYLRARRVVQ